MKLEKKIAVPGQATRQTIPQDAYKSADTKWKSGTARPFVPQFNFGTVNRTVKPE